jgi:hypothetical protein
LLAPTRRPWRPAPADVSPAQPESHDYTAPRTRGDDSLSRKLHIISFSGVRLGFIADSSSLATLIGLCRTKRKLSELPQKARRKKMARDIDTDTGRPYIKINHPATTRKE